MTGSNQLKFQKDYWFGPTDGPTPNIDCFKGESLSELKLLEYFHFKLKHTKFDTEARLQIENMIKSLKK